MFFLAKLLALGRRWASTQHNKTLEICTGNVYSRDWKLTEKLTKTTRNSTKNLREKWRKFFCVSQTLVVQLKCMACDWGQNPKLEISFPRFKTGKKKNFFAWIHHSCSCQQAHERSHRNPPPHLLYFSSRPTHLRYRCGKEIEHLLPTTYYLRLAIVSVFLPLGSPARLHGPRRSDRVWFSWKKKKSRRFFLWNTWLKQQLH